MLKNRGAKGAVVTVPRIDSGRPKKTNEKVKTKHAAIAAPGRKMNLNSANDILSDQIQVTDSEGLLAVFWVEKPKKLDGQFLTEVRYVLYKGQSREESLSVPFGFKERNIISFIPEGMKESLKDYSFLISEAIKKREVSSEACKKFVDKFQCRSYGKSRAMKCDVIKELFNEDEGNRKLRAFAYWNVVLSVMFNAKDYL